MLTLTVGRHVATATRSTEMALMSDGTWTNLLQGFLGSLLSSGISVWVAIFAIHRTQRIDHEGLREGISLTAAERLTAALLDAIRELGHLSDHEVVQSRMARRAAVRALANNLQLAADLHAPILLLPTLSELPSVLRPVLEGFVVSMETREITVMREERLAELDEDRAYAADGRGTQLRDQMAGYLKSVTEALTTYRQHSSHRRDRLQQDDAPRLPAAPVFAGGRPDTM